MPWPITFDDVLSAAETLQRYLVPTPLRNYPALDAEVGVRVLVKHENHQPTNSFKVRNALSALSALPPDRRRAGVVAATRGNHGLGLAYAGRLLETPVTICVPVGNNPEKNRAIRDLGAQLVEEGGSYDDSVAVMEHIARQRGLTPIHSTNNAAVIAGAATITLEAFRQAADMGHSIDAVVVAVGGGSQAVGAMTVLRRLHPAARVFGVQAERASAIYESWRAGRPVTHPAADTFADGIATRCPYKLTFDALREGLAGFVLVSEAELAAAVRLMIRTTHNLAEGAGAAGLAGLLKLADDLRGATVLIVLSGSNIDQHTLRRVMCEY